MIKFSIEANPPLDEVVRPFRKTYGKVLDRKMGDLAQRVHRNISDAAPERKGNLRRAIRVRKRGEAQYEVFVDSRAKGGKYEEFVRLGTAPHVIMPKNKRALFWPGLLHPVRIVHHPGTKPNPYWERGLAMSEGDIDRAEEDIGTDIESELVK